jgi:hypothetical protein
MTSWSKLSNINEQIWPHEQMEFQPHDQKFDLLKKLNFNLMKFDLLTPTLLSGLVKLANGECEYSRESAWLALEWPLLRNNPKQAFFSKTETKIVVYVEIIFLSYFKGKIWVYLFRGIGGYAVGCTFYLGVCEGTIIQIRDT